MQDDENQARLVAELVSAADHRNPLVLNPIVVAEAVWVLERVYDVPSAEARHALALLMEAREFHLPPTVATGKWKDWFGLSDCGFSDVVIARLNRDNGCSKTLTFDRKAARRIAEMDLLT